MRSLLHLSVTLALASAAFPSSGYAETSSSSVNSGGLGGPEVPGVCLLSREAIYANAAVGKAASKRLQQLSAEAQAEIETERKPIDVELQAFRAALADLDAQQRQQRDRDLSAKLRPIQEKAELRAREIEVTREKVMQRIADEAQSVIKSVYERRNCGILFDRNSVLGGNFTNDLTASVVQELDVKISTIQFDREQLPVNAVPPSE